MKKALLFLNGGNLPDKVQEDYDFKVCCNGGSRNSYKLGIIPDIVIGDLDSLDDMISDYISNSKIIKYPKEKDKSDAELAIEFLKEQGVTALDIIGCTGKRFDHELMNIFLVSKYSKEVDIKLLGNNYNGYFLNEEKSSFKQLINKGINFSLIPLQKLIIREISGAKYDINNAIIRPGDTLTLSNEGIGKEVKISIEKGRALLVISKEN